MTKPAAIVILGARSLETARRIQAALDGSEIYGLASRVEGADVPFDEFGETLRGLYESDRPIVALCAAGIVIRSLAPLLQNKRAEPPVLAVAEDGSAVVPLLGGLSGVNVLAREIGAALDTSPAITTTGEIRFGTCLINPPAGYHLRNPEDGKTFIANLLAGAKMRVEGEAPWFADAKLPIDEAGQLAARITHADVAPGKDELLFHPRNIVIGIGRSAPDLATHIRAALGQLNLSPHSLALILAREEDSADPEIAAAAGTLGVPLRFLPASNAEELVLAAVPAPILSVTIEQLAIAVAEKPEDIQPLGRKRGRLSVVGLGPGEAALMVPAVRRAIDAAEDILGYETYVKMAGPLRPDQIVHATDNREELQRARHAFELASSGRSVVMVSSGDPGIFAMAAAVLEALDEGGAPEWHGVELEMLPGVSAAMAAASRIGAPLGHDFCVISLSDNLKPWATVLERLRHAAEGDFAMAFYNPISKARPWQLSEALDLIRRYRAPETPVVIGRDVGRPAERVLQVSLGDLTIDMVDSRTVLIIGSSLTRTIARPDGSHWVYTPRWYGERKN
ncbi:precorrin-3B C(17)-methyltransferase [Dongia sp.]|uniref:precorrin-3B C(17)-methyltransferase n=1 Tax=Dongia sp. TaxID=1977262 RepID=UPI0035ADB924